MHGRFHVARKMNEGVDSVHRRENKRLGRKGDRRLMGTKRIWLRGIRKMSVAQRREFKALQAQELEVCRAWIMKQVFDHL